MPEINNKHISSLLVWTMSIASCVVVSNIYYNQPLLVDMMHEFHVTQRTVGLVPIVTLFGYAIGLLLLVPLGDMIERKKTILISLALAAIALILVAVSVNLPMLIISSLLVGIFSVVPQLLIPFAAHLANPAERGKVVGMVMSGLLIGILLSRTLAGQIDAWSNWRVVYWFAAGFMVLIWIMLFKLLPQNKSDFQGSYADLLKSLGKLIKEYPSLRESAIIGALLFATLNAFWATLIFVLKVPPYHYGAQTAGYFGLLGAAGALFAPLVGKMVDKSGPRMIIGTGMVIEIISFIVLFFFGYHLAALIAFVLLMDLAQQSIHISNQTKVFALDPAARSRLNTVYMFSAFVGSGTGSAIGSLAFSTAGLAGVAGCGIVFLLTALSVFAFYSRKASTTRELQPVAGQY